MLFLDFTQSTICSILLLIIILEMPFRTSLNSWPLPRSAAQALPWPGPTLRARAERRERAAGGELAAAAVAGAGVVGQTLSIWKKGTCGGGGGGGARSHSVTTTGFRWMIDRM